MNPIKSKDDFKQCPIADKLLIICDLEPQQRCACDDICAVLCLPFGILIDCICMCPRYGIYICCNKCCNKQIEKPKIIITEPHVRKQFKKPRFIISEPAL